MRGTTMSSRRKEKLQLHGPGEACAAATRSLLVHASPAPGLEPCVRARFPSQACEEEVVSSKRDVNEVDAEA